eukprot:COSAG02_NODE_7022_length_3223_cov_2.989437_1_plen_724_part_00
MRSLLGLAVVGCVASGAFSAEDACVKVLHALCGNETASADLCLGCTTQHHAVFQAAGCASTEMTQFCNQAAGSPVQPTVVARLLYDEVPSAHSEILVHAWDPKNHRLFSGGKDGQIHQWNISTQTRYPSLVQPANLSAPVTDLLVDHLRSRLLASSTIVHQRSSNVTLPYPTMLTAAAARDAPPPPKPAPAQGPLPVGGFTCGKGTTCDDSAGQNALNISEMTVQVLSDRVLAINVTCSPWHNRTFSVRNGQPFDNPHCYHIDDHRCTEAPASIKPERCCTGWQLYNVVRNYYCAEQYVSWEGAEMVFDNTPPESAASSGGKGPNDCFQEVIKDCGGFYQVSYGHYWFNRSANRLVWKLAYVQSHDNHGTTYGFANITMPSNPNASIAMPADTQSKHVVAEWTYFQAGKLTPDLYHLGVLAGHDHSKDYANYSDDVVNTMALDAARGKLAVSVSDAVFHEHEPTLPGGGYQCIEGDPPWDTCGQWSGVEISRINLDMASHDVLSSVGSDYEARAVALNRTAPSISRSVVPPVTVPVNLTISRIDIHWKRSGGSSNNETQCTNQNVSFNPITKVMTFLDVDKPSDCLGKFLKIIAADKFSLLWYREDDADSDEGDGLEKLMLMASIMGEAVNASLRCNGRDTGCSSGTLGGPHMTAVPRDTILQWDVNTLGANGLPVLGVPSLPTETSCQGINCTSGESVEGEVAVAMDIDTFYQKLYTINHHR